MEIVAFAILGVGAGIAINWLADFLLGDSPTRIRFTWRPAIVVFVTAVLFVLIAWRNGMTAQVFFFAFCTTIFLNVFVTDAEDRAVFPILLVPATIIAILTNAFLPMTLTRSLLGGAVAFVIVFGIYAFAGVYARLRKLKIQGGAFGRGDVYLATFMGVVIGFPAVLPALAYTILLAGAWVILFLVYQFTRTQKIALNAVIPYGPFFCIAGWYVMIFMS